MSSNSSRFVPTESNPPWIEVFAAPQEYLERTPVVGGQLYRNWVLPGNDSINVQVLMAFVPTSPLGALAEAIMLPSLHGIANVENTLTCTPGTWTNSPTSFAFQWRRDGVPIAGATNATYTLTPDDNGTLIDCVVTATTDAGVTEAPPTSQVRVG